MMNNNDYPLSKSQAIDQVISQMTGPLDVEEFIRQVLALSPSKAKNPKAGIQQALQFDFLGKRLIYQEGRTLIPLRLAMPGVRFRDKLSRQEIEKGWLLVDPAFRYMATSNLPPEEFWLEDTDGHSIPVNPVAVKSKIRTIWGTSDLEQTAFDLDWWYRKHSLRRGDSILITVLDWEKGSFGLEPESARVRKRHQVEIQQQNKLLADHIYQQLENEKYEDIRGSVAIPTAYFRLKAANAYPADHWLDVLENDPRMQWTGYEIRYPDWASPLESMFNELRGVKSNPTSSSRKAISKQAARQVYRFKAFLWRQKRIWRRIEIQGEQTLEELDDILRTAFEHDHSDHLGGFWKLVRRGQTRRFREVDLGNIYPYSSGEEDASATRIASLSLNTGDSLKYVYDFGDWIEHRLKLEAIAEPEEDASYPRIADQNKPRYEFCWNCKAKGLKTVATWICLTCSNKEQEDVLLCESCMYAHDEDHYLDEILY